MRPIKAVSLKLSIVLALAWVLAIDETWELLIDAHLALHKGRHSYVVPVLDGDGLVVMGTTPAAAVWKTLALNYDVTGWPINNKWKFKPGIIVSMSKGCLGCFRA